LNSFERLLDEQEMLRLLDSIEVAACLIVGLLVVTNAVPLVGLRKRRFGETIGAVFVVASLAHA
jgi:hypothetical protein